MNGGIFTRIGGRATHLDVEDVFHALLFRFLSLSKLEDFEVDIDVNALSWLQHYG